MKQRKKVAKRKYSKRIRSRRLLAQDHPSQPDISEDEIMNQLEMIVNAFVDARDNDLMDSDVVYWENEEGWLEYLERRVERIEHRFRALKAITLEDIHESTKLFQEELPEYGVFPIERYLERFITLLRDKFRKALYFARIERDAERLRMAIREEVLSLCAQSILHAYDFIKLPPQLPQDDVPELSEEERAEIPDIFCRRIWWMMADDYPEDCATHFYLECPEGWFSAEIYGNDEDAELEAQKRSQRGEGEFEILEITEGDEWVVFVVLFSKQRPKFVG
jgi:hypothetical protein